MSVVFEKLSEYWCSQTDDDCLDIPLTEVNQLNALGEQPIHIAAWKCGPEEILWLLDHGADINSIGDFGMTPLHYAYMAKKIDNVKILLKAGADSTIRCERGLLPGEGSA
jgi:ankyrin repeat protein